MSLDEKKQLKQIDQVKIPNNLDLYHNPTDLTEEIVKRIAGLPLEFRNHYRFLIETQGRGVFYDVTSETIEVTPSFVRVCMTPFSSET
jgi:hypothetical protein